MKSLLTATILTIIIAPAALAGPTAIAEPPEIALRVKQILSDNCHRCHGEGGSAEGGLGYILSVTDLVQKKRVVPGQPEDSILLDRIVSGDMPADDDALAAADIDTIRAWIKQGAPDFEPRAPRELVSTAEMIRLMQVDMLTLTKRDRQFTRYLTLTHLYNANIPDQDLDTFRMGVSKLINSLSFNHRIVKPRPIDANETIFRIDLRDYAWTQKMWDTVQDKNPYIVEYRSPTADFLNESAGGKHPPFARADWFVSATSVPPLYHELLGLPETEQALEKKVGIDTLANVRANRVARSGFNGSGVSQNNRLIERHNSRDGAYWKSYDFAGNADDNDDRKNLFANPLGPEGDNAFKHDGGEIIFNLPNGLQAYFLATADGKRINKGPIEIVSDPRRPDRAVVNGLSCISCHSAGMIPKTDQIRTAVINSQTAFSEAEFAKIKAIYPKADEFSRLMKEDADRFATALEQAGAAAATTEPVSYFVRHFEKELDLKTAAAEAGLTSKDFLSRLVKQPELIRNLGPLLVQGQTVKREVFDKNFQLLSKELGLQNELRTNSVGMPLVLIPSGKFQMGTADGDADESPRHEVEISRPFYLGQTEVTVAQFQQFIEETNYNTEGGYRFDSAKVKFIRSTDNNWKATGYQLQQDQPVVNVSWDDANAFCVWLSKKEGVRYRLPTEAEWEYACRAGSDTKYWTGDVDADLETAANIADASFRTVMRAPIGERWLDGFEFCAPVGSFAANPFGLLDMHGNVLEWCQDRYATDFYKNSPSTDPAGPSQGTLRVARGGSWGNPASQVRSGNRTPFAPTSKNLMIGFRVVREFE